MLQASNEPLEVASRMPVYLYITPTCDHRSGVRSTNDPIQNSINTVFTAPPTHYSVHNQFVLFKSEFAEKCDV